MQEFHEFKPSWVEMSEAKLKKLLTDQKYPYALMQNIFTQVRKIKADRKAARTKLTVLQQRWDDVLRPARTELATVRTMKSQVTKTLTTQFWNQSDKDKFNALCAYETVLVEVIQKLRKYQHEKDEEQQATPQQVAKLLREAGVRKMPNDGTHWTDYVGGATRKRVSAMFNALPEPRRGKRKTPFEHRISPEEFDRLRSVLVGHLVHEQSEAERELNIAKNPEDIARLKGIVEDAQLAYYKLSILPRTHPLPKTWRGLLNID